jgi:hypothetical protein
MIIGHDVGEDRSDTRWKALAHFGSVFEKTVSQVDRVKTPGKKLTPCYVLLALFDGVPTRITLIIG